MVVSSVSSVNDLKNENNDVTIVHFYADWSDECKNINTILDTMSSLPEYGNVAFKKCDAENLPDLSKQFHITEVPTLIFLKDGSKVDELTGADPAKLHSKLKQYIGKVDNAISSILHSDVIVALVDGDEQDNEMLTLLKSCGSKYTHFNVSADESIKTKVQAISGSTNFPQLFIKGTFIGDYDKIKNMNATGELLASIEAANKNMDKVLVAKLRSLIHGANIVVFMKGNENTPRCGFSRQIMEILKGTGLRFETFDILEDEDVRQGLKTYSNWPTYPQVYVKGELVGGLDIIKSLESDGELISTLRGEI